MKLRVLFLSAVFSLLFVLNVPGQYTGDDYSDFVIDSIYIPAGSQTSSGNGSFTGPLGNTQRTYQLLINQSELTALIGKEIKAITWRRPASATTVWPATDISYSNFDLYLSGSVEPALRSLTFIQNVVGPQTLVRSGSLSITTGAYPFGGSPNFCGPEITFDSPWLYTGGHLLIELRHLGFTGTSTSVDAFTTSSSGYGSLFSACWTGNYAGTAGTAGNFSVVKLTYDDPVPVELVSFTADAQANTVLLNWSTATETNNKGFYVERTSGENWINLGFVEGAGTTTESRNYSFTDNNLLKGIYTYRLKQVDLNGSYEYSASIEAAVTSPGQFQLAQNYPNPFNPSTKIEYSIPVESSVKIVVLDILGNEIQTILNEQKSEGIYELTWNAANLPGGVYFYRIQAGSFSDTKKMILIK